VDNRKLSAKRKTRNSTQHQPQRLYQQSFVLCSDLRRVLLRTLRRKCSTPCQVFQTLLPVGCFLFFILSIKESFLYVSFGVAKTSFCVVIFGFLRP